MNATYSRTIPRAQIEDYIGYLCQRYPKCFFTNPHLKRPLKKDILDDLEKDGVLDDEKRTAAVAFYTRDWTYQSLLQAGTERIDLDGNRAGTVTQLEQHHAQKQVQQEKQQRREARINAASPIAVMSKLHAGGQITTDQLSKVTLVPLKKPPPSVPAFGRLQKLMETLNAAADTPDEELKQALVATTLQVLIGEAQQLIERRDY